MFHLTKHEVELQESGTELFSFIFIKQDVETCKKTESRKVLISTKLKLSASAWKICIAGRSSWAKTGGKQRRKKGPTYPRPLAKRGPNI